MLPLVDWVGLDIKAPLADATGHDRVTAVRDSAEPVRRSLAALVQHGRDRGLPSECRTIAHPTLLDDAALLALADELASAGVEQWVLQIVCSQGVTGHLCAIGAAYPSPDTPHSRHQTRPPRHRRPGRS